jgi:radical SAM protein with 4Fe4S-binding SPASM domain
MNRVITRPIKIQPVAIPEQPPERKEEFKKLFKIGGFWLGKEVSVVQVLKCLTLRRIWNAAKILLSFILSGITKKNFVWGVPIIANIEPTNICNLRCPLCVTGSMSMERPYGRMDFSTFKKVVDDIGDRIIYITLYHQGEPYLHKQFSQFVAYAKKKKIYVTTSTNAHFFTKALAEEVVLSGLDSMIVSVDGATQETYGHYRRGGTLATVQEGIRNLVDAKKRLHRTTPYLFMQFLVMQHNEHEIPAMKEMAWELGVDRLLIKTTQVMTAEEARDWLPKNGRYRRYDFDGDEFKVKRGGQGVCPRPWLTTLVDWNGKVVPCCFDKNGHHTMGDINSSPTFSEIWRTPIYQDFRQRMLTDRQSIDICKNCNQGIRVFI